MNGKEEKKPLLKSSLSSSGKREASLGKGSSSLLDDVDKPKKEGASSEATQISIPETIAPGRRGRPYYFFSTIKWYEYIILLLGVGAAVVQGGMPLAFYFYFGKLVDYADKPLSELVDQIRTTSYYFFGIAVVGGLSAYANTALFLFVGERLSARIRRRLFQAIAMQDISFFDRTKTGLLITRLSEDSVTIKGLFSEKLGGMFVGLCQCIGGLGFAFYYSWSMTLVMLGMAPIMGIAIGVQGKLTVWFTKQGSDASANAVAVAEEVITNFRTVKSFAAEEREVERFTNSLGSILSVAYKKAFLQGGSLGFTTTCIWSAAALAFLYGGVQVDKHELTLGELITVFGMMLFAVVGLSMSLTVIPEVFKTKASFALIAEVVERLPDIPFSGGSVLPAPGIKGHVKLDNLSFTYPTRQVPVLQNVTIEVFPGQTVALVGESGSGKSTIFGMIERYYDPNNGRVLIDGHDIREFDPHWYHSHVALVSQEPILFSGTIEENIKYAKPHATHDEVVEAARAANAHDFIIGLPDAYLTKVGERGLSLSGGQKQRVAIARAVLKDPKILLLDEATSALDAESEHLVQQALDKLMVGRTSFIIAHRLSTVRNADVIFVLRKGTVVESGTHDELLDKGGVYLRLANRQLTSISDKSDEDTTEHDGDDGNDNDNDQGQKKEARLKKNGKKDKKKQKEEDEISSSGEERANEERPTNLLD
jgi:ATP-binding cassette subfamily B (MDR/TAP) protein 1